MKYNTFIERLRAAAVEASRVAGIELGDVDVSVKIENASPGDRSRVPGIYTEGEGKAARATILV